MRILGNKNILKLIKIKKVVVIKKILKNLFVTTLAKSIIDRI